jgi:formylmethanofuran dehydrogenase subunit A
MLRNPDPTKLFLTSDHPNGAPFTSYPQVIEWLMSWPARQEMLKRCHPAATHTSGLTGIQREYSLGEVFAMTSSGPARALGMTDRGHLNPGALADLRCYRKQPDLQGMFSRPAWVMRRGQIVIRDGQRLPAEEGGLLVVRPSWDEDRLPRLQAALADLISIPVEKYALGSLSLPKTEERACKSATF